MAIIVQIPRPGANAKSVSAFGESKTTIIMRIDRPSSVYML